MKEHILLKKAFIYANTSKIKKPRQCIYDKFKGYWKFISNGAPMMLSEHPYKLGTKKADIETGEDQKGE